MVGDAPGHAATAGYLWCGDRLVFIVTPLLRCINDTCYAHCLLPESSFKLQEDLKKRHPFIEERLKGQSCSDLGSEFVEIFII